MVQPETIYPSIFSLTHYSNKIPFQYSDLVLQRVLLPLQRLLVDDLDGVHLPVLPALGQPHLGESSPEMIKFSVTNISEHDGCKEERRGVFIS